MMRLPLQGSTLPADGRKDRNFVIPGLIRDPFPCVSAAKLVRTAGAVMSVTKASPIASVTTNKPSDCDGRKRALPLMF